MKRASLIFLAACTTAAWGDTPIYKWVDSQGVPHYSTVPHSSTAAPISIVNRGDLPNASTAPAAATAAGGDGAYSVPSDATLVAPTDADSPDCKAGRQQLFKYLHSEHLYTLDEKGQKQEISAADQAKVVTQARNYVNQVCGHGGSS